MMKIGQQLEAPKLHQKTLETPGIFTQSDRKVVTMDWLMFGFGSVRFNNWAIKSDATTKAMGFFLFWIQAVQKKGQASDVVGVDLSLSVSPTVWQSCETPWFEVTVSDWKVTKNLAKEWEIHTLQLVKLKDISYNWTFNCQQNWRTSIWKILGIPVLWVLFDSRRGSTRSWNRWSKRPFSTTTRWPTFQQFDWLSTVQP